MYRKIRRYFGRIPLVAYAYRAKRRVHLWLSDVRSAYLTRSTTLQATPFGFMLIGTNSIHHRAMQEGTFEPHETRLFRDLLRQVDVFVDVGANVGFYTCLARQSERHVVAVEPLARNLKYLYANLVANKWENVEIFPVGVGDSPGLAVLYGGSSTGASLIASWAGAVRSFRQTIPISTLDILLGSRFSGKRLLIKVDVEGAEYLTLLGAKDTLRQEPRPIWVVEICLNEYHPEGMNPHYMATFDKFWEHGYEARTADKRNNLIQRADVEHWLQTGRSASGTINYKFVPVGPA